MNNRFKFRAWDKIKKRFYNGTNLNLNDYEEVYSDPAGIFFTGLHFLQKDENQYIIQQYTGLNDKHGKEIYEGDIVQYNQNSSYDNMDFIAKWSDDKLGFIFQSNSGDELLNQTPHLNRFKHLEVVGNIFENSELLK
jgi:uncharacterized phage protein (TIGR01671 family)